MSRKKHKTQKSPTTTSKRFEDQAAEPRTGLVAEFWEFFRTNKKWWMVPIVVVLLVVAGIVLLGGTALAPFIYTLF
jgi:hypothetical protein